MLDKTAALLDEREKTHGDWNRTASAAQRIKDTMRAFPEWGRLSDSKREAYELVATKLARGIMGDPDFPDHLDDAEGYLALPDRER